MSTDTEHGGPSAEDRQQVYAHLGIAAPIVRQIENMIAGSNQRQVGRGALTNVRVRHNSRKNKSSLVVESHTCELVFAYELEFDLDVLGYYVQVPVHRVRRTNKSGGSHISSAHLDFLVIRKNAIELIECKQPSFFERNATRESTDWELKAEGWTNRPYADWASEMGLAFRVWVAPTNAGLYLQNLELCYSVHEANLNKDEERAVERAASELARKPSTILDLTQSISGFNERLAVWMLSRNLAFGALKSVPIRLVDKFTLYRDGEQAASADELFAENIAERTKQTDVRDPLLNARPTDLARARMRLDRLDAIAAGEQPRTKRMSQLERKVCKAVAHGRSRLSACLTNYANCGNRTPRLLPEHEQAIETVMARFWRTGKVQRPLDLFHELERECQRLEVDPCSRSRLDAVRRGESATRHALASGGFRAYHASRPRSDPRYRSLRPLGFGQILHIDSSDLDVRCAPNLITSFPASKAKLYVGIDGATGIPMACSLIFGPARTDGLALLMRELVRLHGSLPRMLHLDRGPENTSSWLEAFCFERGISARYSPTAGSQWNGIAENAIKQVNFQEAHHMEGSTAPDQKGRKVDGKFKSFRNARLEFSQVAERIRKFFYEDLPKSPDLEGITPHERMVEAVAAYGHVGTTCKLDDDFLVQTSIQMPLRKRTNVLKGIRTQEGWFNSDELLLALRQHQPSEIRSDCCDPYVLYVRVGGSWIKAFHREVLSAALLSNDERLYSLLYAPIKRFEGRSKREEAQRRRYASRREFAEAARAANKSLRPSLPSDVSSPDENAVPSEGVGPLDLVDFHELAPFEEREDY